MKWHKYNARRAYRCGECGVAVMPELAVCPTHGGGAVISFDSKAEAARWDLLSVQARYGKLHSLERQVAYPLQVNGVTVGKYVADFRYSNGRDVIEDVKGFDTPLSKWKRKHCELQYGIKIDVIKA